MTEKKKSKAEELQEKINALKAKKALIVSRESKEKRKADTKAKIVIGSYLLTLARKEPEQAKKMIVSLEKGIASKEIRETDAPYLKDTIESLKKIASEKKEPVEQKQPETK